MSGRMSGQVSGRMSGSVDASAISTRLGEFVATTGFDDLDPAIVERAKKSILDLLGVTLCGSRSESAAEFERYVTAQRAAGEATVLGAGRCSSAYYAALLNGTFAHATELSETFNRAVVHPGNVVLPAVLAVAERQRASGRDAIRAAVVGYEVLIRAGLSLGTAWMMDQGYHPPSAVGPLGSAAAAASLLGLEPDAAAETLGIAACLTPSTLAGAFRGATVKELFEGYAAATGVLAADLAAQGITGVAEWPRDWYRAVARRHDAEVLIDGLGSRWKVGSGGLRTKTRAVAAMATPTLDAVQEILAEATIRPDEITSVRVESARRVTIGGVATPPTVVAARASVPFLTAFALARQDEFLSDPYLVRVLTKDVLEAPEVRRLASTVDLVVDEEIDRAFEEGWPPAFAARVTVTAGGATHERYVDSFPRTANLSWDDLAAKFRAITSGVLAADRAERLVERVRKLDEVADVRDVLTLAGS
ncbi:2-methylcitrate dehydratase [Actinomadura sp. NBRC 104412]|uniref:MmgE/PrpD family protein n=1 Tax=Actinomadura sp. NBRC 104412 TaxID=3032203 RepID=UPI0024A0436E|nr:MmgE/PrpD family protein [Actinomadura sp. NBRC 104412]GLZ07501.1 2-methylcitrate dehydratase [Actinomadura sp. NBRC 104412]